MNSNKRSEEYFTNLQNNAQSAKFDPTDEVMYSASQKAGAPMASVKNSGVTQEDMLIGRVYKKDFEGLRHDIEKVVAAKVVNRINQKKQEFINNVRGEL